MLVCVGGEGGEQARSAKHLHRRNTPGKRKLGLEGGGVGGREANS